MRPSLHDVLGSDVDDVAPSGAGRVEGRSVDNIQEKLEESDRSLAELEDKYSWRNAIDKYPEYTMN